MTEETVLSLSPEELMLELEQAIRNEDEFTKAFKHKLTDPTKLGASCWAWDEKVNGYGMVTPNGSILRLRFYNTVKPIFDYMNVEVPGKESYLSYIEVVIRPAGIKGYMFKSDVAQQVWGDSKSKAEIKHLAALEKLAIKAKALGIDVTEWVSKFDRTNY
jgi:hypothetical protein